MVEGPRDDLEVKGSSVRVSVKYGRIGYNDDYMPHQWYCYDPETGEPIPGDTSTPTPWLDIWHDRDEDGYYRPRRNWD